MRSTRERRWCTACRAWVKAGEPHWGHRIEIMKVVGEETPQVEDVTWTAVGEEADRR